MSTHDPASPTPESASDVPSQTSSPSDAATEARSRSPLERVVVWGLILGLGGLAGYEAVTRFGHQNSVAAVDNAYRSSAKRVADFLMSDAVTADIEARMEQGMSLEAADAAATAAAIENNPEMTRRLTVTEAEALMSGFPHKSTASANPAVMDVTYHWKTLLKQGNRTSGGLKCEENVLHLVQIPSGGEAFAADVVSLCRRPAGIVEYVAEPEALEFYDSEQVRPEDLIELEEELVAMGIDIDDEEDV